MSEELINAIAEMQEENALALTKQLLANGAEPLTILNDCRLAMELVGKRFEEGKYFIPELILAGEVLKQISAEVKPRVVGAAAAMQGARVLVGTVKGDIHDIGKDIVAFMLDVNGFVVKDLGVDVPIEKFVSEIKSYQPSIVALSGFLTLSYTSMKETVDAIKAVGLRESIKIMIGGGTVDDQVRQFAGADAFGKDAMAAVALARQWTSGGA
ncbi:MAG: cobalamin-dependent protein [Chloroflexota bacterium]